MEEGASEVGFKDGQMTLGHSMCKGPRTAGLVQVWKTAGDGKEDITGQP